MNLTDMQQQVGLCFMHASTPWDRSRRCISCHLHRLDRACRMTCATSKSLLRTTDKISPLCSHWIQLVASMLLIASTAPTLDRRTTDKMPHLRSHWIQLKRHAADSITAPTLGRQPTPEHASHTRRLRCLACGIKCSHNAYPCGFCPHRLRSRFTWALQRW